MFRVGVDIGGTFTDIVLLDASGRLHTKKVSSSVDDYARAIIDGPRRGLPRHRDHGGGHRRGAPRNHRGVERGPRAEGRPHGADHHAGVSRRPRDPPPPDAAALRPHVGEAGAARRALPAPGGHRAHRRARRGPDAARPGRGRAGPRTAPRRRHRGPRRLPDQLLRQPRARGADQGARQPARARPGGLLQRRGAAGDPRVRAHIDHRDQRLRDADRAPLSRPRCGPASTARA